MFIDISRTLSPDSVVFPGDRNLEFVPMETLGADSHFGKLGIKNFSGHVMSHVDVPSHVFENAKSLNDYDVNDFVFDAVVHAVDGDTIDEAVIARLPTVRDKAVLFKTRCSEIGENEPFAEDFVHITKDGADALVDAGVIAVGIDYLSVDAIDDHIVHHVLMSNDILIFETLQFKGVEPGEYKLFAFPLKIRGGDGSCVRAVLETKDF